jgi:hypothetical protein
MPLRASPEDRVPKCGSPEGEKGLPEAVEIQLIMVEALQGQKMDSQSADELGTRTESLGAELQEQEAQGTRPQRSKHPLGEPGW